MKTALQKAALLVTFTGVLPALLAVWTVVLPLPLPVPRSFGAGAILLGLGGSLMGWATLVLWFRGGGLPLNAFPPPRWVASGPYRLLSHPMYAGFTLACGGTSLLAGSPTGFWLTTPLVALGCTTLVVGYEGPSLVRRFGATRHRPLLSFPAVEGGAPTLPERCGSAILVLGSWMLVYLGIQALGAPPDRIETWIGGEAGWPVWSWAAPVYASAYLGVPAAFLLAHDRGALRDLVRRGLVATGLIALLYLCLPFVCPPRPVPANGAFTALLRLEHAWTLSSAASFPSFHVAWAGLAASAVGSRGAAWRTVGWCWALLVAASCIATGMHSLLDVLAAMVLWPLLVRLEVFWAVLLRATERLSNSWKSWRLGPLRILSHSPYPGLAAALGFLGACALHAPPAGMAVVAACVLLGAGLVAWWIEGSPELSRPFGFHGGMAGAVVALLLLLPTPWGGWRLAGALATVVPLVQALGRLRCLVQGCCHGAPAASGIRVHQAHSRIVALAGLAGVPIHPTPLYSILGNLVVAALVARLWSLRLPLALVAGAYLVLSGLARFMEEAYRGEPQTPAVGGLHLYQWFALATVAAGMVVAPLPSPSTAGMDFASLGTWTLFGGLACGLAFAIALGVDFPGSARRFARLSG